MSVSASGGISTRILFCLQLPEKRIPFLLAVQIERHDDDLPESKDFEEITDCARDLNLAAEWTDIIQIVAGVLHLGNIDFEPLGEYGSKVATRSIVSARYAAEMLGFTEARLQHAITNHTIKIVTRGEETSTPLLPAKAIDSRNGVCPPPPPCHHDAMLSLRTH
jgi:myosin heavy subunit